MCDLNPIELDWETESWYKTKKCCCRHQRDTTSETREGRPISDNDRRLVRILQACGESEDEYWGYYGMTEDAMASLDNNLEERDSESSGINLDTDIDFLDDDVIGL
jgi:hypothetical protein